MLGPHSLGMEIFVLHFLYFAGPYPWDVDNVCFTFPLYVIALCMMYVYLYMLVYGWSWTLYDGLSWLHEWPSLVISAFDLIEWICAKGYYCLRYIVCMIIAMWSSRSMSPSDIDFLMYAIRINMFDALRGSNSSQHEHVGTHRIYRPETLPMRHNAPNTKLCQIFAMKMGHLRCHILMAKTW